MKKSFLTLASILAIVAGCAREDFSGLVKSHSGITEVTASLPSQTKTYLADDEGIFRLFWFEEEPISVGAGEEFLEFSLIEGADTPNGKFESSQDLPVADTYYAISPEMPDVKEVDGVLTVNYPSELTYQAESGTAEGGEVMVAKSTSTAFAFRNAMGYIKFQMAVEENEELDKIEISDSNGASITGQAKISFEGNDIKAVSFTDSSSSTVSINFLETTTVTTEAPFVIYIPVAPMPNGATFTVTTKSGKSMTMKSSTPIGINQIVELPVITFKPVKVAKVDGIEYYSIKQAIIAAEDAGKDVTIQITADCNVGANCEILSNSQEITLDLNGHTLYGVGDNYLTIGSGNKNAIIMDSSAEQTGTITNRNSKSTPLRIFGHTTMRSGKVVSGTYGVYVKEGSFIMEGGTIDAESTGIRIIPDENKTIDSVLVTGSAYIDSRGSSLYIHSPKTELIIRGGEIHATVAACNMRDGVARIYDGTFCAKSNVIYQHPAYDNQLDIFGGKFHRDSINTIVYGHTTTDSTRVVGGFYNNSFSDKYLPAGYCVTACDTTIDGRHYSLTVTQSAEIQASVSINGGAPVEKATINDAFNTAIASGEPALITLLSDCTPTSAIEVNSNNPITLDFNGKTLTCNGTKLINITGENSDVTFKTSVEGGGIHQASSSSKCQTFRQTAGKLTIENGIYEGTATQYAAYNGGGDTYVNGGEFIGDTAVFYVNTGTLHVNGGKFTIRETSTRKTIKQICIYSGNAIFNGGEFVGVYAYSTASSVKFESGNYPSFTLSGACDSISIENGTFDQIHFEHTGTVTVKNGTFNNRVYMDGNGTLNIEGGEINYNENDTYKYALFATFGTINIKNTTINGCTSYGALRFRNCVATIGEGTVVNNSYSNGTAVFVGHSSYKSAKVTINGGTFNSKNGIKGTNGTLTINDGTFNCTGSCLMDVNADVKTEVYGGYFNTTATTASIEGDGSIGCLKGGWFNRTIPAAAINSVYMLDDSKSTEVGGVTYNYHVVENAAAPTIATVNGVEYKDITSAITATKEYAGSDDKVTLKLLAQDTVTLYTTTNLTNENGKEIILDLNNRIIKGTVDSLITTQGTLTITDSSSEKGGTITAAKRRMIFLDKVGTLNLKGVTIDCQRGSYGVTTGMYSAVVVYGTSDARPTMNISDGTVVKCKYSLFKAIFVYYGNLNTENCEVITNYNLNISGTDTVGVNKGYPAIMASTGAVINIGKGSFIQARGETNSRGALNVRFSTGDAAVTVEDGTYFWSPGANGSIVGDDNSGIYATQKALYLNGGYFYKSPAKYIPIIPSGKSIQEVSPVVSYTSSIGETVTFDYQVK